VIREDTVLLGPERTHDGPEYLTPLPTHKTLSAAWTSAWLAGPTATWPGDGLRAAQVKSLVRGIESGMKHESADVYRVDVVPSSRAPAVSR
jgi:hypothetical protein